MIIYTDGSARPNPGPGGFGVVVLDDNENLIETYRKDFEHTTNNEMELKAILYVMLKYGKKEYNFTIDEHPPVVYSDSAYCVNTFNDWMFRWAAIGWVKSDKQVPENLDLIQAYFEHYQKGYRIDLRKIKGHSGDKWNEMADGLATGRINPEQDRIKNILEVIEL